MTPLRPDPLLAPVRRRGAHAVRRGAHRLVPGPRELPRWFVVGAKRAGTTSLVEYVLQHPATMRSLVEKGSRWFDVNHDRGRAWFERTLPAARWVDVQERRLGVRPIVGESSPYLSVHPDAPSRIAATVEDPRLVLLLREPVARAWSHHRYEVARGFEQLDFAAAVAAEAERLAHPDPSRRARHHRHHSYVLRSRYAEQIDRLRAAVGTERLLVVESERLFEDPVPVMARVHEHLGLAPFTGEYAAVHKANPGAGVPPAARALVQPLVADSTARLRTQLDDPPRWVSDG